MPSVLPITYAGRLLRLQSAQEVAWGTALAATANWMGLAPTPQFKPYIASTPYDEDRGALAYSYNSNVLRNGGEYSLNWVYASYDDINYDLMNVLQSVTPTVA